MQSKSGSYALIMVTKRDGSSQKLDLNQIWERYACLLNEWEIGEVDLWWLTGRIMECLKPNIRTDQIDGIAEDLCAYRSPILVQYHRLATAIVVDNIKKRVPGSWAEALARFPDDPEALVPSKALREYAWQHKERLDKAIEGAESLERGMDYPAIKIMEHQYMLRGLDGKPAERIAHFWMRTAAALTMDDGPDYTIELFEALVEHRITFPTPVLRTAGTNKPHYISCFLGAVAEDSTEAEYEMVGEFAKCSKLGGALGVSLSKIRGAGSFIKGCGGESGGIIPYLQVLNAVKKHIKQGTNKRAGVLACYLEPWHIDFLDFVRIKKQTTPETMAARDLFPDIWMPDLFWDRVEEDGEWSFFCPSTAPGLDDVFGSEFDELYRKYEKEGKASFVMAAADVLQEIASAMILTGTPGIMAKDTINATSSLIEQSITRNSNLCEEITIPSQGGAKACCILGAVGLPAHVKDGVLDIKLLRTSAALATVYVDKLCDMTKFPNEKDRALHLYNRPIGIGVSGLADTFVLCGVPWESDSARILNTRIFAHIHHACITASCYLSQMKGPAPGWDRSTLKTGELHPQRYWKWMQIQRGVNKDPVHDIWPVSIPQLSIQEPPDWNLLSEMVVRHKMRNLLLNAAMPTANCAAIVGNNECFEPFTSNVYVRGLNAGDLYFVNKHLIKLLERKGLLTTQTYNQILTDDGSVKNVSGLTTDEKELFKIAWEISPSVLVQLAADRQAYLDQSQSFNSFMADPTASDLAGMLLDGHKKGLKTLLYYLRTKPPSRMVCYTDRGTDEKPICANGSCTL